MWHVEGIGWALKLLNESRSAIIGHGYHQCKIQCENASAKGGGNCNSSCVHRRFPLAFSEHSKLISGTSSAMKCVFKHKPFLSEKA